MNHWVDYKMYDITWLNASSLFHWPSPSHFQTPQLPGHVQRGHAAALSRSSCALLPGRSQKKKTKVNKVPRCWKKKNINTHYYNHKINSSKPCYHGFFWSCSTGVPDSISFFMGHKAETHLDGLGNIHQQTVALVKSRTHRKKKLLWKNK